MSKFLRNPFSFKAVETKYDGCLFRSRLEARWATFFNALSVPYEYEKETLDLGGVWYLPDFWLPQQNCWIEIKGQAPTEEERDKARRLALFTQKNVATFYGNIELPNFREMRSFFDRPAMLWTYHTSELAPGGPSTQFIEAPSPILALLQKTKESFLDLYTHPIGGLVIKPSIYPCDADDLDGLIERLQQQCQVLSEIRDFLGEHKLEIQSVLTPADGYQIGFFEQEPEGLVDMAYWGECNKCGTIKVTTPFVNVHCCNDEMQGNDETLGDFLHDTPRLKAAYEAARSARFESWRR